MTTATAPKPYPNWPGAYQWEQLRLELQLAHFSRLIGIPEEWDRHATAVKVQQYRRWRDAQAEEGER